MESVLSAMQR